MYGKICVLNQASEGVSKDYTLADASVSPMVGSIL